MLCYKGMSETGAETPTQTETKPVLGKRKFEVAGNTVEVGFVRFSGEEKPWYDPKKAAFLLTGWPMRYDAQITWGQPQMLAKEFGVTTYEIDGRPKGSFNMDAIALEIEGLRQFATELEQNGINKLTLFGHSIGATKALDLAVALEQNNPNLRINVVLINPAGLYAQNIWELAKKYAGGAGINAETKNPNRISQDFIPILVDMAASIYKDIKDTKINIFKLWRDQKNKATQFNANLAKIKSPVMIMVATDDPVFPPEAVLPPQQVDQRLGPLSSDEQMNIWLQKQVKWEKLPAEKRTKYGTEENFINHFISAYRRQEEMTRLKKAREQYLKEKLLPNASDVRVIVATKYANHIAFGVERPRPSSHIIARYFDRVRR